MSTDLLGTFWKDADNVIFEITEEDLISQTCTVVSASGVNLVSESFLFDSCEQQPFRKGDRLSVPDTELIYTVTSCFWDASSSCVLFNLRVDYLVHVASADWIRENLILLLDAASPVKPTTHGPHTCKHCRTPGGLEMFSHFLCMNSACLYYAS